MNHLQRFVYESYELRLYSRKSEPWRVRYELVWGREEEEAGSGLERMDERAQER